MKKLKAKWAALLAAIGCFAVCFGVGVANVEQPKPSETVTANAATTYASHDLGVMSLNTPSKNAAQAQNTQLYLLQESGAALPYPDSTWNTIFTYESGDGFKVNGSAATLNEMKSTDGGLYLNFTGVNQGDVVSISGTYVCEDKAAKYVIKESKFVWNGTSWNEYVEMDYTEYKITELTVHVHSTAGNTNANATTLWLYGTGDTSDAWATYNYMSGAGVKLNGKSADIKVQDFSGGLYLSFAAVSAGDIVSIGGTYANKDMGHKYIIPESQFQWDGSGWAVYVPPVEYTPYTLSNLTVHLHSTAGNTNASNTSLWISAAGGATVSDWPWFVYESGAGFKVNGESASLTGGVANAVQDFGGGIYFTFAAVNSGDVVSIGGVYSNADLGIRYTIPESKFTWNGSGWEVYVPYEEYTLSNLQVANTSKADGAYCANTVLSLTMTGGATVSDWPWFVYESGAGFKVNGESASLTGGIANAVQDTTNGLYFQFAAVNSGDVVSIGGTFINKDLGIRYTIPESQFQWNGTEWVKYYTQFTVGKLTVKSGTASGVYFTPADSSKEFPVNSWTDQFSYVSGNGITVDGTMINMVNTVKSPGSKEFYVDLSSAVSTGAVLKIGGVLRCEAFATDYVIDDCQFQWNGTEWVEYVEYTSYKLGVMSLYAASKNASQAQNTELYLLQESGAALPYPDSTWNTVFTYESGDGLKVNSSTATLSQMKSTNLGLYLKFTDVKAGDVVSISGTYVCEDKNAKYVIEESKFLWNGSIWVDWNIEYTNVFEPTMLTVHTNSSTAGSENTKPTTLWLSGTGNTSDAWNYYTYVSGVGFKVNGESATLTKLQDFSNGIYLEFNTVEAGDVITIGGTYVCNDSATKYVIPESSFMWNGTSWTNAYAYTDDQLASYDLISISDIGLGVKKEVNATAAIDNTDLSYTASAENTTGSVKFRFEFTSTDIAAGLTEIRLRGTAWKGIRFLVGNSQISSLYKSENNAAYALSSNTKYLIELGAIDLLDGENIWIYAKVDGVIVISDVVAKTATNPNEDGTPTFSTFTTNNVSCYFGAGVYATLTDPDHVEISYVTSSLDKTVYDYADKNSEYTLWSGNSFKTFVGWVVNGKLYFEGDTIEISEDNVTATALELDFQLKAGASIRLGGTADVSGIRFTTLINQEHLTALQNYGATVSYGTLIIPYDYLKYNQKPNLTDFDINENLTDEKKEILMIPSTYSEVDANGYVVYRGAMQKLYTDNYERLFAGRGYMEITLNGTTITVYTPFNEQDNIRSIRHVAQAFVADTSEPAEGEIRYDALGDTQKGIVNAYALNDGIDLMNYASYAANQFLNVIAFNYPKLDESNNYNNATNIKIAEDMKKTGIRVVNLTGANIIVPNSEENIEKTRQIIEFFWSQGLQTVAFAGNNFGLNDDGTFNTLNSDYTSSGTPDFSDCEGFLGFLHWDEPTSDDEVMAKLAALAIEFDKVYAGTDVTFMVNLLPSYAPYFQTTTSSWFGSSTTLDKDAYKAYVEEYCTTVLSKVKGEKWLSVDTYPINADYSLHDTFLFDLGVIKYYAMENGAHAHVVLQSSGFASFVTEEDGSKTITNDTKARIPTEAEMRMQAYAAMAFGMDSLSWFTYSPSGSGSELFYTMVDNDGNIIDQTAYAAFTAVNTELKNIGSVYAAFDWKGVILGAGTDNTTKTIFNTVKEADNDYAAFEAVSGQIGNYELSASETKHLSSVATNKTDWNYLMGVMQDMNGNEGYVLCNYNSHEEDRAQTITITFASNITQVVIYRGGEAQTVDVSNKTLTVDLATGEGVTILPSKLG